MSLEENKQIAKEFLDCMKNRNAVRLAELLADDFHWVIPARSPTLDALKAPRDKTESVARIQAYMNSMARPITLEPFGWTAEGNRVAVEVEGNIEWDNGKVYDNLYHMLFELRDGKIEKLTEYCDLMFAWETSPVINSSKNAS